MVGCTPAAATRTAGDEALAPSPSYWPSVCRYRGTDVRITARKNLIGCLSVNLATLTP